jgi:DNA-directed RNA polymerase subunit beta
MQIIRDERIQETGDDDPDVEWELDNPNSLLGHNASSIPMYSSVQAPRVFYGARFANQATALKDPEAPWVQTLLDERTGESADDRLGRWSGAIMADEDGVVDEVDGRQIKFTTADGRKGVKRLYDLLPFNRKSALSQKAVVQPGQAFKRGEALARSNFTDAKGTLAMGVNARVALVPYMGFSQDDAVVVSRAFANRLQSEKVKVLSQEYDDNVKGGKNHFHALFPKKFLQTQLDLLDDDGFVLPGTILQTGDPISLATKPRTISSARLHLGTLGKAMQQARADASQVWDGDEPAEVVRVEKLRDGTAKAILRTYSPAATGDKIVFRAGAKGVISKILEDEHMPRTADGRPLEVLYNPAGLVSRANDSMVYEMLAGKIAEMKKEPFKVGAYTKKGEAWFDVIQRELEKAGLSDTESVYDPQFDRVLDNPVTVGSAYALKLHHTAESKSGARSDGGYDLNQQPVRGGEGGAKRLSGLETSALQAAGAYHNVREGSTLRGQANYEYWQQLKQGLSPAEPGRPFVWSKYLALLQGAGLKAREVKPGTLRLGPMTDVDLDEFSPVEVKHGGTVDLRTMTPEKDGLFDPGMISANKWGYIKLDRPVLNPAMEDVARRLLGLKRAELREVLAGRKEV